MVAVRPVGDLRSGFIAGFIAAPAAETEPLLALARSLRAARLMSAAHAEPLWLAMPAGRYDLDLLGRRAGELAVPRSMLLLQPETERIDNQTVDRLHAAGFGLLLARDGLTRLPIARSADRSPSVIRVSEGASPALTALVQSARGRRATVLVDAVNDGKSAALAQAAGAAFGAGPIFGRAVEPGGALTLIQECRSFMAERPAGAVVRPGRAAP